MAAKDSVGFTTGSGASLTTGAIVVASNANRVLDIAVMVGASSISVSSVTRDGQSAALVRREFVSTPVTLEIWRIVAPNTGSATASISLSGSAGEILAAWISAYEVNQTTPNGTIVVATTGSFTTSTLNPVAGDAADLVVGFIGWNRAGSSNCAFGVGQAEDVNEDVYWRGVGLTSKVAGSAGSVAMSATMSGGVPEASFICYALATDAGGADTTAPLITGPSGAAGASTSNKSIAENTTAVHTFTADESVTWSLNGGADAALFTINGSTGALAFSSAPNYESPADADTNNIYVVVVRATDTATNTADQTVAVTVTDADEVSPTISSPAGASAAPLLCTGSVSTNEGTGTLYAVVTASATAPSAAQVKAGQDHTGSAALRVVSQAVSSTGSQGIASGSVTAGTRYWHYMHEDAAANQSTVASSASFTVAATLSITTDALEDEGGAVLASVTLTRAYAIRLSDHALVASWASPATNGSGQLVLADAALTAAPHLIATVSNSNADAGAKVYTPA